MTIWIACGITNLILLLLIGARIRWFESRALGQLSYIVEKHEKDIQSMSEHMFELETKLKETHFDIREIKSAVVPRDID
jgi:hypothetical protein